MEKKIGVVGLGYVGLPIAVAFGKKQNVIGFDINSKRIEDLRKGIDYTGEVMVADLQKAAITYTDDPGLLRDCDFIIVAVPTPVDKAHRPDLTAVIKASEMLGGVIKKGSIIVYESTVYPGVTEEICGPVIARTSGLRQGVDFKLGYSPERINPGDKEHHLENITKVVSGEDEFTTGIVADVYGRIINAGVYRAASIRVAEAAKVIENTQRDLNIALMNELAIIFDKMNIRTADVLNAASTKWNFMPFKPGLVGGHCIGVDPYYLTYKAEELGYHPEVILAGRRINDGMGKYIAEKTVKRLSLLGKSLKEAKVGILGVTFKENVPDLRNSKVPDIISELSEYGIKTLVHDPVASSKEALSEYGLTMASWEELNDLDVIILAVPHREYIGQALTSILSKFNKQKRGVFIDIKSVYKPEDFSGDIVYASL